MQKDAERFELKRSICLPQLSVHAQSGPLHMSTKHRVCKSPQSWGSSWPKTGENSFQTELYWLKPGYLCECCIGLHKTTTVGGVASREVIRRWQFVNVKDWPVLRVAGAASWYSELSMNNCCTFSCSRAETRGAREQWWWKFLCGWLCGALACGCVRLSERLVGDESWHSTCLLGQPVANLNCISRISDSRA